MKHLFLILLIAGCSRADKPSDSLNGSGGSAIQLDGGISGFIGAGGIPDASENDGFLTDNLAGTSGNDNSVAGTNGAAGYSGFTSDGVLTGGSTSDGVPTSGSTSDGVGGSGSGTGDGVGGTGGSTGDGVGGSGNTGDGAGGTGNTGDGVGGTGNTGDGSGGTGNTGDGSGGGTTTDGPPPCFPSIMDGINTLVFEDATLSGADTEGRLFIGGNATLDWTVGTALEFDCSRMDLVVGGDLVWNSGSAQNGMVVVGGSVTRANGVGAACGIERNADAVDFDVAEQAFLNYSTHLTFYPTNGTVNVTYGTLTLIGTNDIVNIFSLNAIDFLGVTSIQLQVPVGSAVIINISGTNVALSNFGFGSIGECKGGGTECHMIIWNMYEAETVTISGIGLQGSLLAPLATVDFSNGMIDGQLIVRNLTGSGEHHPFMFTGCYELEL